MIKLINLLHKKPDINWEFFVDYYEHKHVPLVMDTIPEIERYVRNFVARDGAVQLAHVEHAIAGADFDVLTEFWFADRPAFDSMMTRMQDPVIAACIAKDEGVFLDRTRARVFTVEEHVSERTI